MASPGGQPVVKDATSTVCDRQVAGEQCDALCGLFSVGSQKRYFLVIVHVQQVDKKPAPQKYDEEAGGTVTQ